jgi:hypothetical protein
MYYLETNSIRALDSEFINKNSKYFYTSYKTIYELISGMTNENEFKKRKRQLLKTSGLQIDWSSPRKKIIDAFGFNIDDIDTKYIQNIFYAIVANDNYEYLISEKCIFENSTNILKYIKDDGELSEALVDSAKDDLRRITNSYEEQQFKKTISNNDLLLSYLQCCYEIFLRRYGEAVSKIIRENYFDIIKNYNNSLDNFIRFQIEIIYCLYNGRMPGHNDIHDITHLLYLMNDDILVSNDKVFYINTYLHKLKAITTDKIKGTSGNSLKT